MVGRYYALAYNRVTGECLGYVKGVINGGLSLTRARSGAMYRSSKGRMCNVVGYLNEMYGGMGYFFECVGRSEV